MDNAYYNVEHHWGPSQCEKGRVLIFIYTSYHTCRTFYQNMPNKVQNKLKTVKFREHNQWRKKGNNTITLLGCFIINSTDKLFSNKRMATPITINTVETTPWGCI